MKSPDQKSTHSSTSVSTELGSSAADSLAHRATTAPRDVEVWIGGKRVCYEDAQVSVFDRGFLYGDSVFETLRTYAGRPFALDEHLARLAKSAARVYIELPVSIDELRREVYAAVAQSAHTECYVRVMITRGIGALGLDPRMATGPLRVFLVGPLHPPALLDYQNGIATVTFAAARPGDSTAAQGAKIGNYLVAVLAQKKASEAGAKEALITTPDGEVIEGATSNLFWLEGQTLWTVPSEAGILEGITRAHLLRVAPSVGLQLQQRIPQLAELLKADAVFVSSSIREMLSVVSIDGHRVGDGRVHPLVAQLHDAFRREAVLAAAAEEPSAS